MYSTASLVNSSNHPLMRSLIFLYSEVELEAPYIAGLRDWCILSIRLFFSRESFNKCDNLKRNVFFFLQSSMPCLFIALSKSGVKTHDGLFPVVWRCFFL